MIVAAGAGPLIRSIVGGNAVIDAAISCSRGPRAAYVMGLLILAGLAAFIDVQILSLLVTPIKQSLGVSDAQIGLLQGVALNLSCGLAAFPLATAVDRGKRMRIIAMALAAWSLCTAGTGFCQNVWELFLCRAGVGVAEAAVAPAAYSLIADLYQADRRVTATLIYFAGNLLATGLGIYVAGLGISLLGTADGSALAGIAFPAWRLSFVAAAVPGFLLAILFLAAGEPERQHHGEVQAQAQAGDISFSTFFAANWLIILSVSAGLAAASLGVGAVMLWMPTILHRAFAASPGQAGEWLGIAFGIGSLAGVGLAGLLVRWLRGRYGDIALLQVVTIGALAAAGTFPLFLLVRSIEQTALVALIYVGSAYVAMSVGPAVLTMLAPNQLRGRVIAIWTVTGLLTSAIAPPLVGWLSDAVFAGSRGLLVAACAVVIPCAMLAPVLLAIAIAPVGRALAARA